MSMSAITVSFRHNPPSLPDHQFAFQASMMVPECGYTEIPISAPSERHASITVA